MDPSVVYTTDQTGHIVFYKASSGAGCDYTGRSLFTVFTPAVRPLLSRIHEKVLQTNKSLSLEQRCDDSDTEHHLGLTLTPIQLPDGEPGVHYASELLSSRPRTEPFPVGTGSGPLVYVCSWCDDAARVSSQSPWEPISSAMSSFPARYSVSHGICTPCENYLEAEMDSLSINH